MKRTSRNHAAESEQAPHGSRESLWLIALGPAIWMTYFLVTYATAAIWCAKVAERAGPLGEARLLIGLYTLIALLGIGTTGWIGYRRHSYGAATVPHDFDTSADRHRFLGFATLLLCALCFVSTVYVALVVVFIGSCA